METDTIELSEKKIKSLLSIKDKMILDTINGLTDSDKHHLFAALTLGWTRYNTTANGGLFYDFSFANEDEQNKYASCFSQVEAKLRTIL